MALISKFAKHVPIPDPKIASRFRPPISRIDNHALNPEPRTRTYNRVGRTETHVRSVAIAIGTCRYRGKMSAEDNELSEMPIRGLMDLKNLEDVEQLPLYISEADADPRVFVYKNNVFIKGNKKKDGARNRERKFDTLIVKAIIQGDLEEFFRLVTSTILIEKAISRDLEEFINEGSTLIEKAISQGDLDEEFIAALAISQFFTFEEGDLEEEFVNEVTTDYVYEHFVRLLEKHTSDTEAAAVVARKIARARCHLKSLMKYPGVMSIQMLYRKKTIEVRLISAPKVVVS